MNRKIKNIKIISTNKKTKELKEYLKNKIIIFIYPKNFTSGCTNEALQFKKVYIIFKKLNTEIIGVSKDDIESHLKFKKKNKLPFDLISDEKKVLIKMFGAWGEKSLYGKKFMGVNRTTILINKNKKIINIWNNVKVKNHAKKVLKFLKNYKTN